MGKTLQGGRRPGSGRRQIGDTPRVLLSLSVDEQTRDAYRELRHAQTPGKDIIRDIELFIRMACDARRNGQRLAIVKTSSSKAMEKILDLSE